MGSVPDLKGCDTQGKTQDELKQNLKEAIQHYLVVQEPDSSFIGVQEIEV